MSLSPCRIPYYAFNNSIYTSQIFRTKIKIILYLLQSHLTQLDHLYQTPSPKPGCRKLGPNTCQYTWVHLHPSSTDTIAWHQVQYCLWSWKTMHPLNLQFLLIVAGPLFIQTMSNRVENIWRTPVSQLNSFLWYQILGRIAHMWMLPILLWGRLQFPNRILALQTCPSCLSE